MALCRRSAGWWLPSAASLLLTVALLRWLAAHSVQPIHGRPAVASPSNSPSPSPSPSLAAGRRDHSGSVLVAVRTSSQLLTSRLPVLAATWLRDSRSSLQVRLFSDSAAVKEVVRSLDGVGTEISHCGQGHTSTVLCCRLAHEIAVFADTRHGWFCHFDDDNYVNTAALQAMLVSYQPRQPWYLGREHGKVIYRSRAEAVPVRFATGGAGFCISRATLLQAAASLSHGQLENSCRRLSMPDDVTLGYILWESHRIRLTHIAEFHSHLEQLSAIPSDDLKHQISLSYSLKRLPANTVNVAGLELEQDPTRFRSLHCLLHGVASCS